MAGLQGLTAEEQKIYDEYKAGGEALLAKAKADAAAIGTDLMSIIGPTEAAVVKEVETAGATVMKWWQYLLHFLDFLDGPTGKFSSKRLVLLATAVIGIREMFLGHDWHAVGCGVVVIFMGLWISWSKS
jgi:type IV secretory pathway VirB2 component (pilin)